LFSSKNGNAMMSLTDSVGGARMIVDSLGRVGIGTGSPGQKLDVNGNIQLSSAAPQIQQSVNDQNLIVLGGSGTEKGAYFFVNGANRSSNPGNGGFIVGGDVFANQAAITSSFQIYGAYAGVGRALVMTVLGSGNVGIGTTTPQAKLDGVGKLTFSDTIRSGNYTTYSYFIPGGSLVTSSDENVKINVRPFALSASALSFVESINPRKYEWKKDNYTKAFDTSFVPHWFALKASEKTSTRNKWLAEMTTEADRQANRTTTGFIAQEVNALLGKPNSKEIDYGELNAVLWQAVQELSAKVKALETRVRALER